MIERAVEWFSSVVRVFSRAVKRFSKVVKWFSMAVKRLFNYLVAYFGKLLQDGGALINSRKVATEPHFLREICMDIGDLGVMLCDTVKVWLVRSVQGSQRLKRFGFEVRPNRTEVT